jgi:dolichyl-phosphate beta-glucosyltransferase
MTGMVVVIPCFNEETRLRQDLILEWAQRRSDWIWLLVDDGSRDATRGILESLANQRDNVIALPLPHNVGKAEAVRQAMLWAQQNHPGPWYSYLDADFATPPSELERLHRLHFEGQRRIVLGCRLQRLGAQIRRSPVRHFVGRTAATFISLVLKLPTYDTQCGAKMIHQELLQTGFRTPFISRWLFDVELLARCRNELGAQRLREVAVEEPLMEWADLGGSKLRGRDFLRIPNELWRIHRRYNSRAPH